MLRSQTAACQHALPIALPALTPVLPLPHTLLQPCYKKKYRGGTFEQCTTVVSDCLLSGVLAQHAGLSMLA